MKKQETFFRMVCNLAIPVALQSMLQASFGIVDQIMIGQLGSVSVAGVGLAGKFFSIFSVLISAVGVVAGIMISQYMGQDNPLEVRRSFYVNLGGVTAIAVVFSIVCLVFPQQIMSLYTKDSSTLEVAAEYLFIASASFLLMAGSSMISTLFRCMEKAKLPLYANMASLLLNTGLNYLLIFGKFGLPTMGAKGAAVATLFSQLVNFIVILIMLSKYKDTIRISRDSNESLPPFHWRQYVQMLLPILVCEFMWSLGENIYAAIYGNMGTEACAAMTLTNPVQGLTIGALCGLSQAASVIVGKKLGTKEFDEAYDASKKLIWYGVIGSLLLSAIIVITSQYYVQIYQVEESVKLLTQQILWAYAVLAPFKVLNMIVGGGIIRSGGKTDYVMYIDMIGTWCFGVPLGFLAAFVLKLPIPLVYFMLSLEECVRLAIAIVVFRKKKWMRSLQVKINES